MNNEVFDRETILYVVLKFGFTGRYLFTPLDDLGYLRGRDEAQSGLVSDTRSPAETVMGHQTAPLGVVHFGQTGTVSDL